MKDDFNRRAGETPKQRLEALKEKGQAIDKWLRTPQRPQQQLTPKGNLRQRAHANARQYLEGQRVDIAKEVKAMEQRMQAKEQNNQRGKSQGQEKGQSKSPGYGPEHLKQNQKQIKFQRTR